MHALSRASLLALIAALALAAIGAGAASASRSIQVTPGGAVRMVTRSLTFGGGEGAVMTSEVTLTGSLHRAAISKANGLAGFITRVDFANCSCTVLILNLPWHIRLVGFLGTLPNISGVALELRGAFRIDRFSGLVRCLYEGSLPGQTNGPRVTSLLTTINSFGLISGEPCDATLEFLGAFTVSPAQELRLL